MRKHSYTLQFHFRNGDVNTDELLEMYHKQQSSIHTNRVLESAG